MIGQLVKNPPADLGSISEFVEVFVWQLSPIWVVLATHLILRHLEKGKETNLHEELTNGEAYIESVSRSFVSNFLWPHGP